MLYQSPVVQASLLLDLGTYRAVCVLFGNLGHIPKGLPAFSDKHIIFLHSLLPKITIGRGDSMELHGNREHGFTTVTHNPIGSSTWRPLISINGMESSCLIRFQRVGNYWTWHIAVANDERRCGNHTIHLQKFGIADGAKLAMQHSGHFASTAEQGISF
jgi:hypothetical protein